MSLGRMFQVQLPSSDHKARLAGAHRRAIPGERLRGDQCSACFLGTQSLSSPRSQIWAELLQPEMCIVLHAVSGCTS